MSPCLPRAYSSQAGRHSRTRKAPRSGRSCRPTLPVLTQTTNPNIRPVAVHRPPIKRLRALPGLLLHPYKAAYARLRPHLIHKLALLVNPACYAVSSAPHNDKGLGEEFGPSRQDLPGDELIEDTPADASSVLWRRGKFLEGGCGW